MLSVVVVKRTRNAIYVQVSTRLDEGSFSSLSERRVHERKGTPKHLPDRAVELETSNQGWGAAVNSTFEQRYLTFIYICCRLRNK